VVFEILSPGNTRKEMNRKLLFYHRYQVEEYYLYDPHKNRLTGWLRNENWLDLIDEMNGWVSPRLGIRFELASDTLVLYRPDGQPFADYLQVQQQLETVTEQLQQKRQAKQTVTEQLQQERQAKQIAEARAQQLEQLLREAGIDPEQNSQV